MSARLTRWGTPTRPTFTHRRALNGYPGFAALVDLAHIWMRLHRGSLTGPHLRPERPGSAVDLGHEGVGGRGRASLTIPTPLAIELDA